MSDIFLSYNREDQAIARRFAVAFEREGFSVWWDATLHSGEAYDQVTEKALEEARAVVVLWSKKSVDSRWVRAEATTADRNGTLVPVMIEACRRPIMFELTHTADLSNWKGDANDPLWRAYVADVRRFVERAGPLTATSSTAQGSTTAAPVTSRSAARGHIELRHLGECVDQFLGHAVTEIVLVRFAREIGEGHDRNRCRTVRGR